MDFGCPNAEIDRRMANGQLLFLALYSSIHLLHSYSFSTCSCGRYFHAFTSVSSHLLNTQSVDKLNSSLTHIQQTQSFTSCRSSVFINNHFLNIKQTVYSVFLSSAQFEHAVMHTLYLTVTYKSHIKTHTQTKNTRKHTHTHKQAIHTHAYK